MKATAKIPRPVPVGEVTVTMSLDEAAFFLKLTGRSSGQITQALYVVLGELPEVVRRAKKVFPAFDDPQEFRVSAAAERRAVALLHHNKGV